MSNVITPSRLEIALALSLDKVEELERALTEANMRALEAEKQRDVALDERDAAIARAQKGKASGGATLRHEATQASVYFRCVADSLRLSGRTEMARHCVHRADKLVEALK